MLGWLGNGLWCLTFIVEVAALCCVVAKGPVRRYATLALYLAAVSVADITRYSILSRYGSTSQEYSYFYYYSDAILTICLYFALMGLYSIVLEEMRVGKYVRLFTILLLAGTALFSFAEVQQSGSRLLTVYVLEMSQNLYFVGVVLTYILWGAIMKMRESRARVVQLVLSLGVTFSAFAINYALLNLQPRWYAFLQYVPPALGSLLPLSWAYAFWHLPEESRLATAQLAAVPR